MVSVLTRAKKCAKIPFVFEKDAGVAQSVEQLIRNQQVRCSSHPTSSKKRRKLRFSMLFCCKNAENGVGQNAGQLLTHTLTHTRNKLYPRKWTRGFDPRPRSLDTHLTHRVPIDSKSAGEEALPPLRYFVFFCLHDLCHEAAHRLRGFVLLLTGGVGVGTEREACIVVPQHTADSFHVHAVL